MFRFRQLELVKRISPFPSVQLFAPLLYSRAYPFVYNRPKVMMVLRWLYSPFVAPLAYARAISLRLQSTYRSLALFPFCRPSRIRSSSICRYPSLRSALRPSPYQSSSICRYPSRLLSTLVLPSSSACVCVFRLKGILCGSENMRPEVTTGERAPCRWWNLRSYSEGFNSLVHCRYVRERILSDPSGHGKNKLKMMGISTHAYSLLRDRLDSILLFPHVSHSI